VDVPAVPRPAAGGLTPAGDPYQVYLDALTSPESRRAMRGCLDRVAQIISGEPGATG
jgi:hypothetical protein